MLICRFPKIGVPLLTIHFWLVVGPPLWKIWKSIGMIIPNICENKTCSKPPTRFLVGTFHETNHPASWGSPPWHMPSPPEKAWRWLHSGETGETSNMRDGTWLNHAEMGLSIYLSIYVSIYLPTYLSIYLPIYLSIYLFVYLFLSLNKIVSLCQSNRKYHLDWLGPSFMNRSTTFQYCTMVSKGGIESWGDGIRLLTGNLGKTTQHVQQLDRQTEIWWARSKL